MTVINIENEAEFDEYIAKTKENNGIVLVDFTAVWCGPCRMIAPKIDEMSETYKNITFLKVDVDAVASVATKVGISAMPTFHIYKNGVKKGEVVGANEGAIRKLIMDNI